MSEVKFFFNKNKELGKLGSSQNSPKDQDSNWIAWSDALLNFLPNLKVNQLHLFVPFAEAFLQKQNVTSHYVIAKSTKKKTVGIPKPLVSHFEAEFQKEFLEDPVPSNSSVSNNLSMDADASEYQDLDNDDEEVVIINSDGVPQKAHAPTSAFEIPRVSNLVERQSLAEHLFGPSQEEPEEQDLGGVNFCAAPARSSNIYEVYKDASDTDGVAKVRFNQ